MKIKLSGLDKKVLAVMNRIGAAAGQAGMNAYVVGGFVRDIILKQPNRDLDIVVEGDTIALGRDLAKQEKAELVVHKQFGTATLRYADGLRVDLAMARQEMYPYPGALPIVRSGTIEKDLFRRDFTINAMAVCINPDRKGELLDRYNGMRDIQKKKIRVLHEKSFGDDPTRILRAVRFEQRFGFAIEPKTLVLLKKALKQGVVASVKPPRYFDAFRKVLTERRCASCLGRLYRLGGLDFLGKSLCFNASLLKRMELNIRRVQPKDFFEGCDWSLVYLLGLAEGMKPDELERVIEFFQLTRRESETIRLLPRVPGVVKSLGRKSLTPSQVYQILQPLPKAIICFIRVRTSAKIIIKFIDKYLSRWSQVRLNVTGDDLRKMGVTGLPTGSILRRLLLKKIDGEIAGRTEEIRCAQKMILI